MFQIFFCREQNLSLSLERIKQRHLERQLAAWGGCALQRCLHLVKAKQSRFWSLLKIPMAQHQVACSLHILLTLPLSQEAKEE